MPLHLVFSKVFGLYKTAAGVLSVFSEVVSKEFSTAPGLTMSRGSAALRAITLFFGSGRVLVDKLEILARNNFVSVGCIDLGATQSIVKLGLINVDSN